MICVFLAGHFVLVAGAKTTTSTNNGAWFQPALPPLTWNNGIPGPSDVVNINNNVNLNTNAGVVVNVGLLNIANAGTNSGFLGCSGPLLYLNGAGSVWSAGAYYSGYPVSEIQLAFRSASTSARSVSGGTG